MGIPALKTVWNCSDTLKVYVFGDINKDIIKHCKSIPVKAAVCFIFKNETQLHVYSAGDCRVYNKMGVLLTEDNSVAWRTLKKMGWIIKKYHTLFVIAQTETI
jgi:hypothetical protein